MRHRIVRIEPLGADQMYAKLEEQGICINRYAENYLAHPRLGSERATELTVAIASVAEIGYEEGATLDQIARRIPELGLQPCPPCAGLFLRLAWLDQPMSQDSTLSGAHRAPDAAVTVYSEPLEPDGAFPKGLYLRNVDGTLWLRGYVCDATYRFPSDALFAFACAWHGVGDERAPW